MGTPTTEVEQITVALIPKAVADLARTRERSKLNPSDVVNRALSFYEFADAERAAGAQMWFRRPDGTIYQVEWF
jgi:hypothetical protein